MDEGRVYMASAAAECAGRSDETVRRWVRAGKFPKPLKDGSGRCYWLRSQLTAWLREQAQRDEQRAARKSEAAELPRGRKGRFETQAAV